MIHTSLSRSFSKKWRATWLGKIFRSIFSLCSLNSFISLISSFAWTRHRKSSLAVYSSCSFRKERKAKIRPNNMSTHRIVILLVLPWKCFNNGGNVSDLERIWFHWQKKREFSCSVYVEYLREILGQITFVLLLPWSVARKFYCYFPFKHLSDI